MFEASPDIYSILSRPYILLILAFILDLFIGDPRWLPHPVRVMGWAITKIEVFLRRFAKNAEIKEKWAGIALVVIIVGLTYGLFHIFNYVFLAVHFSLLTSYLSLLVMVYLISTTIAVKGLVDSAKVIIKYVRNKDLERARKDLGHIVGRDTENLDDRGILRATIESLAENTSDGVIAPLFYFAIGGLPLAMAYKAINTMDSMIGYKNEQYRYFGWAAARLDDIVNYIPARITGILIAISSAIIYRSLFTAHCSLKTMLYDGKKHPSPNSGVPEAAMAGALGIILGGPSTYDGVQVIKPYIGDAKDGNYLSIFVSENAISIVRTASILGIGIAVVILSMKDLI